METTAKIKKLPIGKRVERARIVIGLTQKQLAKRLGGITGQSVSHMEQAENLDSKRLEEIAHALGVTTGFIEKCDNETLLFHIQNLRENEVAYSFNFHCTINPLDKVVELYERLLQNERDKNDYLTVKLQKLEVHIGTTATIKSET
jgi:transcriptional regulator with XRE-family HTH domain